MLNYPYEILIGSGDFCDFCIADTEISEKQAMLILHDKDAMELVNLSEKNNTALHSKENFISKTQVRAEDIVYFANNFVRIQQILDTVVEKKQKEENNKLLHTNMSEEPKAPIYEDTENSNDAVQTPINKKLLQKRPMTLWQGFKQALSRTFYINGRARRKEFWGFFLFGLLFYSIIFGTISGIIRSSAVSEETIKVVEFSLMIIFHIPHLTLLARRLHDINWPASYVFVLVVFNFFSNWLPGNILAIGFLAAFIINTIIACIDTKPGKNKYGKDPKYIQ